MNQEILDGCLLGDGCLYLHKNCKNACFAYTSSQRDHAYFIFESFKQYTTERYKNGPVKRLVFDKRTNKTYTTYQFRTKVLDIFTEQYERWYQKNKKAIPEDINITNTALLYWYIGDGSLHKIHNSIKLSTDCFSFQEVKKLCINIAKYEPKIFKNNNKPTINIPRKNVPNFLLDIGDNYPPCYAYKWDYKDYKNNPPRFITKETFEEIKVEYLKKEKTIYKLSKEYNVAINSIKNYLKNIGLYQYKKT